MLTLFCELWINFCLPQTKPCNFRFYENKKKCFLRTMHPWVFNVQKLSYIQQQFSSKFCMIGIVCVTIFYYCARVETYMFFNLVIYLVLFNLLLLLPSCWYHKYMYICMYIYIYIYIYTYIEGLQPNKSYRYNQLSATGPLKGETFSMLLVVETRQC